jgi:hypothetical protein
MRSPLISITLKFVLLVVLVALVINSWGEVVERTLFNLFGLNSESMWSWLLLALITSAIFVVVISTLKVEAHELFGISELIDRLFTHTREVFSKGKLKHYKIK